MWSNTPVKAVAVNLLVVIFFTSQVATSSPYLQEQHWYTSPTVNNIYTGNRILSSDSSGSFPNKIDVIDVTLPSDVKWLVATTLLTSYAQSSSTQEEAAQFVATTQDGLAYVISANGSIDQIVDYVLDDSDVDQPPLVSTYIEESSNQFVYHVLHMFMTQYTSILITVVILYCMI